MDIGTLLSATFKGLQAEISTLKTSVERLQKEVHGMRSTPADFVNAQQAMELFHVSTTKIWEFVQAELIRTSKPGKHRLYLHSDLLSILQDPKAAKLAVKRWKDRERTV